MHLFSFSPGEEIDKKKKKTLKLNASLINFELTVFLRGKYLVCIVKYQSLDITLAEGLRQVGTAFKKPITM